MIKVRSHKRVRKNGVSIVKRHVKKARKKYGIKTPIKVNAHFRNETQSDSLAHHAMHYNPKTKSPAKHEINLDTEKIKKSGHNLEKVVKHEIGHLVDAELAAKTKTMKKATDTFSKTKAGKKFLGGKSKRSPKERFADKYAKTH